MYFYNNIKDHCRRVSLLYDGICGIYMAYGVGFWTQNVNMDAIVANLHVMFCQYIT